MELTQEFIESNGLSDEQVTAVTGYVQSEVVPNLKKEYEGLANKNAEGILTGAAKSASERFGVQLEREQGEKIADYLERISDSALSSKTEKLLEREKELEDKLKNFKGSDELKEKYEKQLKANDDLLKKVAELEPLKGMDALLSEKDQELTGLKKEVAYSSVKPSFPDTVNKYEVEAKWNEFKRGIEDKYTIELKDGVPYGIDKENQYKEVKLSDLVDADANIKELLKGRQQKGTGANPVDLKDVEGIPFKIPVNASSEQLSTLVREHVLNEVGSLTHKDYAKKFQELYTKVKSA
jgi:hypothetical protein